MTSCFNAEAHLETTLRSVLDQGYLRLEYIVIDGASTDGTLDILRRYESQLAVIESAPDRGQYHGIQKGMNLATGDVMAWLNGDDTYYPWTLSVVSEVFARFPDIDWIVGTPSYMNTRGQCTRVSGVAASAYPQTDIRNGWYRPDLSGYLQQESMFWRRHLWDRVGGLNLALNYAADFDLWRRFAEYAPLVSIATPLALFRQRPGQQRSSTGALQYNAEVDLICRNLRQAPWLWRTIAAKSEVMRHLFRMARFRREPAIAYSGSKQSWELTNNWRTVARTTLADTLLEHSLRKK